MAVHALHAAVQAFLRDHLQINETWVATTVEALFIAHVTAIVLAFACLCRMTHKAPKHVAKTQ